MKRIITTISLVIVFASLFVFGVIFTGGQGSNGSIVPTVQAADNDDDDDRGSCRRNCSLRSLKGCYGFTINGTILAAGPVAGVVLRNYDGEGGFTQVDTVSINGMLITPPTGRSSRGTYTVNRDCTGSATLNPPPDTGLPPLHIYFVLVDGGREIREVVTDPGFAVTTVGKKQ